MVGSMTTRDDEIYKILLSIKSDIGSITAQNEAQTKNIEEHKRVSSKRLTELEQKVEYMKEDLDKKIDVLYGVKEKHKYVFTGMVAVIVFLGSVIGFFIASFEKLKGIIKWLGSLIGA